MSYFPYLAKFCNDMNINGYKLARLCQFSRQTADKLLNGDEGEYTKTIIDKVLQATKLPYEIVFADKVTDKRTEAYKKYMRRLYG